MSTITIQTTVPGLAWRWGGSQAILRKIANNTFTTSDGVIIQQGSYEEIICTVAGTVLTIPSFTVDSTTDSNNPNASYKFQFYSNNGRTKRELFPANLSAVRFDYATLGASTSWELVIDYNSSPPVTFFNYEPIITYIQRIVSRLGAIPNAAQNTNGKTYLDVDPVDAAIPIAVGANSPLLQTTTEFFVSRYGLVGDGTTDDRTALNTLVNTTLATTTLATTGGRIRFDHLGTGQFTDYLISSSITIPSNISVAFDVNTRLKVPKGVTVTLPEPPIAQRHQIFNCTGTGRVIFTKPSTVLPHWWGAVDDATVNLASPTVNGTDCTDALQRAGNTVNSSGGGVIDVSTSDKAFALHGSTGLNYNNFQNVTLRGSRGSLNDAIDGVNLFFTSIPTHCISLDSAQHCTFDGVGIAFMSQSLSGDLLHFGVSSGVASDCTINNCSFSGRTASSVTDPAPAGRAAIYLEEIDNFKITNNLFSNVNRAIETTVSANVVDVSGNAFVSCGNYPIYLTDITESWNIQGNAFKRGHKSDDLAWQGLTLAVQALGTPTSLNFQANWLGDGSGTTDPVPNNTTKNPMLFIQNGAGVTIFNNRFLNETDTDNYAINIDNCVGVNLTTNKFEGTPSLQTTSEFSGYNLKLLLANNEFGDTPDLTWALDYNRIDATNTIGATIIRSIGGDDYVGENAADLGLGSTDGTDPYVGQSGRLGGGIRMGASGEMYFTVREDTTTPFEFWNINKLVSFDSTKASFFIPFGYATGVGGAVTQLTSKSTGATLSKICGVITMNNAALAADTEVQFTLTNTTIAVDDTIQINHKSGGTYGAYQIQGRCGAGSAIISVRNVTGGSLSEAIVLQYSIIKGVVA